MHNIYFSPKPELIEYVEAIHIVKINFTDHCSLSPIYNFVPTHTRFLCFYLEDQVCVKKADGLFEKRARCIIIGPQLVPVTLDLGKKHTCVIVSLRPCSMFRLLGVPLHEIVDKDFDARLILGKEIDEVLGRLQEVRNDQDKNMVVQDYLMYKLKKLKPAVPFDWVMLQQVNAIGKHPIEYLAAKACMSTRQFERKALERIGLSPKLYARMIRFTYAYKFKEKLPETSWNEIAYRFNYFDQMHFIRDFRSFAGFTPSMLKAEDIKRSVRFQILSDCRTSEI
jgi:AraC-like DNA-binding protein